MYLFAKLLKRMYRSLLFTPCFFSALFMLLILSSSSQAQSKRLRYEDYIYEPQIRTVQLYKQTGNPREMLEFPVMSLAHDSRFMLEFDELGDQYHDYYVRILQCDRDWTRSQLAEMEYLDTFNEYTVTHYEVSSGTRTPYTHYKFEVPKVKKSGNYLLVVYRDGNQDDIVITRRFMIFKNMVNVDMEVRFTNSVKQRWQNQQVEFVVDYTGYPLDNPMQTVDVLIRKNGRWDNAIYGLKPLYVREVEHTLDYRHFDLENNFMGGNEYRLFDIRSLYQRGLGVGEIYNKNNKQEIFLTIDSSRKAFDYTYIPDMNGYYIIQNFETRLGDVESEYMPVHFFLRSPKLPGNVYVFGQLSNWKFGPDHRMAYDDSLSGYYLTRVLKQGYYNYKYFYQSRPDTIPSEYRFEGSYNVTENIYDLLIYYRAIGARYDEIIAYERKNYFGRER